MSEMNQVSEKAARLREAVAESNRAGETMVSALQRARRVSELDQETVRVLARELGVTASQVVAVASFFPQLSGDGEEPCADATTYDQKTTGETRVVLKHYRTIDDYIADGGYDALREAVQATDRPIKQISACGVLGRGGSGFDVGVKWKIADDAPGEDKFVVLNAAEGEPGTAKDRALLLANPHAALEGMVICGLSIGAQRGRIFLRAGYPDVERALRTAVAEARQRGMLGENILDSGFAFDVELTAGVSCYICGEETALLEAVEGRRGEPRIKPPYPGTAGLCECPTAINNPETFANIPAALLMGEGTYREIGTRDCPGTKLFTLSGCVKRPGVYEFPFGVTLRQLFQAAGGCADGCGLKGVQIGGNASGSFAGIDKLDLPLDLPGCRDAGMTLGTGAVRFIGEDQSVPALCREAYGFLAAESCGRCIPCRRGNAEMVRLLTALLDGEGSHGLLDELEALADYIGASSMCGLGQASPTPLRSALRAFRGEFEALADRQSGKRVIG